MLEWELVRQAGEEGIQGTAGWIESPEGPGTRLYLTHKETESQREGVVGLR